MKACLIGHNLTNFVIAIILNKKAIKVDILTDKNKKTFISNRTVGISRNKQEVRIEAKKRIDYELSKRKARQ